MRRLGKDCQSRLPFGGLRALSLSKRLAVKEILQARTYRPEPVRRVWIDSRAQRDSRALFSSKKYRGKPGGGQRPLGVPTVRDRVVQNALRKVIEPIFEATFAEHSHGF